MAPFSSRFRFKTMKGNYEKMKTRTSQTKAVTLALFMVSTMAALVLFAWSSVMSAPDSATPRAVALSQNTPRATVQVREAYGQLPLSFEANRGQADDAVNFRARGAGYTIALSPTEAVFALANEPARRRDRNHVAGSEAHAPFSTPPTVLRMNLVGANPTASVEGLSKLEGTVNYLTGSDPARWRTNIPTFGRVRYGEVYPGIDLVYYGNQRRLEYDFVVGPGRDVRAIAFEFSGAESLEIEAGTGDLLVSVGSETIRQKKPVAYQEIGAARRDVESHYALRSNGRIGFEVGAYDRSATLMIDPVLVYSTFLGGTDQDYGNAIAVDSSGNAYVTGFTGSTNFPTANAFQGTFGGTSTGFGGDAFVTKLNPSGSAVVYSTYLGGSGDDEGVGIAVDSNGNAYIVGETNSTNFPTANAFQGTFGGGFGDAFVSKLNPSGSALVYSTYLGGSANEFAGGIAVDSAGSAYVTGETRSINFPIANAIQATGNGLGEFSGDVFITKFNAAGSALVYSTYLGGGGADGGAGIAVDSAGNAYVAGFTGSTNFPVANAIQNTRGGSADAFIAKINPAGSALVYSTYLGGSDLEQLEPNCIAVDSAGNVYVTGGTYSTNFPVANALQSTSAGALDAFVAKINAAGSALVYSTYLGGSDFEFPLGIAVDSAGNASVAGDTSSTNFPTANAFQNLNAGGLDDAFITKLNASGSAIIYSSYLGTGSSERAYGIAVDSAGNAYVTGVATSTDFPTTTGAFDTTFNGFSDAFIAKIGETTTPTPTPGGTPSQPLNISTRVRVQTGDNALIGGFILTGTDPKRVIVRAIGPSLSASGVQGALADTTLELRDGSGQLLAQNDNWRTGGQEAEIIATTIPPANGLESAIVATLPANNAGYTAIVRGTNDTTGIGLVEIYDLGQGANSQLANISTRGFVETGDNALIGGFILGGGGGANSQVVRAIGPSLGAAGVAGALADPTLELKDGNGSTVLSNDDWQQTQAAEINATGLAPTNIHESALLIALPLGSYTAIVRGVGNTTGVGLVEVYNLQ
jgi:hypothetical protein